MLTTSGFEYDLRFPLEWLHVRKPGYTLVLQLAAHLNRGLTFELASPGTGVDCSLY